MGLQVPISGTQLTDVKAYDGFLLTPPNDLAAAVSLGNSGTAGSGIPFFTRWDARYSNANRLSINSLADFRGYGLGGFSSLGLVRNTGAGATLNFSFFVAPGYPTGFFREVTIDSSTPAGMITNISIANTSSTGSQTVTYTISSTSTQRTGRLNCLIKQLSNGSTLWQGYQFVITQVP